MAIYPIPQFDILQTSKSGHTLWYKFKFCIYSLIFKYCFVIRSALTGELRFFWQVLFLLFSRKCLYYLLLILFVLLFPELFALLTGIMFFTYVWNKFVQRSTCPRWVCIQYMIPCSQCSLNASAGQHAQCKNHRPWASLAFFFSTSYTRFCPVLKSFKRKVIIKSWLDRCNMRA